MAPAFMRRPPPTLPGMPSIHSNPPSPAFRAAAATIAGASYLVLSTIEQKPWFYHQLPAVLTLLAALGLAVVARLPEITTGRHSAIPALALAAIIPGLLLLTAWRNQAALIDAYLSERVRNAPERGCPLPGLTGEAPRMPAAARARFNEGVEHFQRTLATAFEALAKPEPDECAPCLRFFTSLPPCVSTVKACVVTGRSSLAESSER